MRRRLVRAGIAAAVVAAVAWAAQTPRSDGVPHFRERDVTIIAHAGASGHAPQNTMPAFERAVELGADVIEMDLQLTADGHVVAMHDGTVDRTTDGSGRVRDLTLEEVSELDAGSWWEGPEGDRPFAGQGVAVPTLEQVLESLEEEFLVVELKTDSGPS